MVEQWQRCERQFRDFVEQGLIDVNVAVNVDGRIVTGKIIYARVQDIGVTEKGKKAAEKILLELYGANKLFEEHASELKAVLEKIKKQKVSHRKQSDALNKYLRERLNAGGFPDSLLNKLSEIYLKDTTETNLSEGESLNDTKGRKGL
ncbi:MAG: hypothetical protein FD164_2385 [Nitrospirae bacterium]|nr:MAG: hypothetical protein FD164_2385 [Nitrospirota bacterium]